MIERVFVHVVQILSHLNVNSSSSIVYNAYELSTISLIKLKECIASKRSSNLRIDTSEDNIPFLQSNYRPNDSLMAIR